MSKKAKFLTAFATTAFLFSVNANALPVPPRATTGSMDIIQIAGKPKGYSTPRTGTARKITAPKASPTRAFNNAARPRSPTAKPLIPAKRTAQTPAKRPIKT